MKTDLTIQIERALLKSCFSSNPALAKYYGCEEVTIGFQRDKMGHEIVDFMSYDAKEEIFRCYEIKVSMADFHSSAKKSWVGHYNYLVITEAMMNSIDDIKAIIPNNIGIIKFDGENLINIRRAKKNILDNTMISVLKDSLIRRLFYKHNPKSS